MHAVCSTVPRSTGAQIDRSGGPGPPRTRAARAPALGDPPINNDATQVTVSFPFLHSTKDASTTYLHSTSTLSTASATYPTHVRSKLQSY
jgi:hypothetical protein